MMPIIHTPPYRVRRADRDHRTGRILYRTALGNVRNARTFAEGDIPAFPAVAKSIDILHELSFSLRHENEPTLARNLVELYDYMQRRLLAANLGQSAEPLEEVETLLHQPKRGTESTRPSAGAWMADERTRGRIAPKRNGCAHLSRTKGSGFREFYLTGIKEIDDPPLHGGFVGSGMDAGLNLPALRSETGGGS
jgi:flagellar protein FliS